MMGQAIGPVIGGLLNSGWGFRSIFWFLFAFSAIVLGALVIFLPETQRSIAGNGSVPLTGLHKPLAYTINPPSIWSNAPSKVQAKPQRPINLQNAFSPLAHILEKDIAVLLAWGSVTYTAWSMVTSSTTTMLLKGFPFLTQWQIGLCFLPNGLGCICGSLSTGWLLNHGFQRAAAKYKRTHGINDASSNTMLNSGAATNFAYIQTRLHLMPLFAAALTISLALYGPSFEFNDLRSHVTANLAAPLILQFIIAFSATAIFNINSTVLIDCFPERPASATALNNLCRCLLGAAGVSVIQPLIRAIKPMGAFFVVTGLVVVCVPLVWVERIWGGRWRKERQARMCADGV
jgi:MFS family permease